MTPTVHFFKIQKEKERRPIVPKPTVQSGATRFFVLNIFVYLDV